MANSSVSEIIMSHETPNNMTSKTMILLPKAVLLPDLSIKTDMAVLCRGDRIVKVDGVNTLKTQIMARLKNREPGTPGFIHFGDFLDDEFEMHFMVTQGMRDRDTLEVVLEPSTGEAGAVNPATQQLDFYIRSPERNEDNHPAREVFDHFFAMEVTWR